MGAERVLSCIQPTGHTHLGNYLGAIKNWVAFQADYDCAYGIVDLHALTTPSGRKDVQSRALNMAMDLLACGIDPEQTILFVQSHVPEHTELFWMLTGFATYRELTWMPQFKDRLAESKSVSAGVLNYPLLQAADILMYKAHRVPVGKDQKQHIELAQRIAWRFNREYGNTFTRPRALMTKAADIRSLADPEKKMSKSYGEKHYVGLFEDRDSIHAKLKRAVTDTGPAEQGDAMSSGVENLFTIIGAIDAEMASELMEDYRAKSLQYSTLKGAAFEAIMTELAPIREAKKKLLSSPAAVEAILADGAERARRIARTTIEEVRERVGVGMT